MIELVDYEVKASAAVRQFWQARKSSKQKQQDSGKVDAGQRGAVTGGKTMDGFITLMIDVIHANGMPDADIHLERKVLTLPGYFRPTKLWDLLVMHQGKLIAGVELKSHVGPSFGNNFNNRCEEAIGTAQDFLTAYREGSFGDSVNPFTGWLILVEDAPKSRSSVACAAPHFEVREEFEETSYADRYELLCRKLVLEKMYTAAAVILSPSEADETGQYFEMSKMTGLNTFLTELAGHVAAASARAE